MIVGLKKNYFRLQVQLLVFFRPAVFFDRINHLDWYKRTLCQWVDDQNLNVESKVLEVGCATGVVTSYLENYGCFTTGIDSSAGMIALAKKNNNAIDFKVANALNLPFEDETFDAVISASLINIIDNKSKFIGELYRTCKKSGLVTILVPSAEFNDKQLLSLRCSLMASGFSEAILDVWHNRAPKMDTIQILSLFKQTGLKKITTKKYLQGLVISVSAVKS